MGTTLTVRQAARAGRCNGSTIRRLIGEGKLAGSKGESRTAPFLVAATRDEVRAAVLAHAPRAGFHQRKRLVAGRGTGDRLSTVLAIAKLPAEKRDLALAIGIKFSVQDLRSILDL